MVMSINISKALKPEISRHVVNINNLQCQIANITNTGNFAVSNISQQKLIIYTNQHHLLKLRRHEDQIVYLLGQNFNFNKIDWRIMQELKPNTKKKQEVSRVKPKSNHFLALSRKCKHEALSKSLARLSGTLSTKK